MYSVLDLFSEYRPTTRRKMSYNRAYNQMYALLSNRCISLFDWSGLPFEQHELEIRTQLNPAGYTGVVYADQLSRWIVANGSGVGVTEYPDKWITYTWACPKASGISKIGTNCILSRNNSLLISSRWVVDRYAHLMAHTLLSLQAILINSRATGYSTASDDQTRKRILDFYRALEDGKTEVVLTGENLESPINSTPISFISDHLSGQGDKALDYWQLYQNLYKDFLALLGISKSTDKRERLITEEVEQDLPLYQFNIEDMMDQRRRTAEDLSNLFNKEVTVDLAESVKRAISATTTEKGGSEDVNNNTGT